jgi:CDP-6-deoxy-D-xylo-4-hexulose-3-dehydrase
MESISKIDQLKAKILKDVSDYGILYLSGKEFKPGIDNIPVSGKVLKPEDFVYLVDSSLDGWFTSGRFTSEFEKKLANFVGVRSAVFVNSGSSANLCALSALTSPKLGIRALKKGDEVITVAMSFPTTVSPIIQNGLTPVFVDIDLETLNVDVTQLEDAITNKTKAIMIAHTLGNPFNLAAVQKICKEHNLWLIEDSCDALGSTYNGQRVGSFGDLATVSFYPAHHITTGEGGAVFVKSPLVKKQVESFRDWGRDCYCDTGCDNTCKKRFEWQLGDLPFGYDHKYIYSHIGYNLKATDMQAALGLSQINQLELFIKKRKENFQFLLQNLKYIEDLQFVKHTNNSDPSWFGFPMTIKSDSRFKRIDLLRFLESRKINTRLLFAGNITKQPAFKGIDFRIHGKLSNTNLIMNNSFWIGVFPGLSQQMLEYMVESISEFMNRKI